MKDKLKKVASAPKAVASHVYARRGRYGTAAGIITGAVLMRKLDDGVRADALRFIEAHDLTDEFFLIEDTLTS